MKNFPTLIIFVVILSCRSLVEKPKRDFQRFDFTYDSGWGTAYSLKFTQSDSIYLGKGRFTKKFYWGRMNQKQLKTLDSFLLGFPKWGLDTAYIMEGIVDNASYKIYLQQDSLVQQVYVYGHTEPEALRRFSWWLASLKDNVDFQSIDTAITFASLHAFYPPVPIPDSVRFLPPDSKHSR